MLQISNALISIALVRTVKKDASPLSFFEDFNPFRSSAKKMSQSRIVPFFKETNEGFPFLGTLSLPTTKKPSKIKLSPLPLVVVHKIEYPTFTNSKHTQEWETFSAFKNRYKVLSDSWNIKQNYSRTKHYNVTPIWNFPCAICKWWMRQDLEVVFTPF